MNPSIITQNKKAFEKYTVFRKQIFLELTPRDSETVLYLLPWLLSINHRFCPGYVPGLEKPFRVFGIDKQKDIRERENAFKRQFGIRKKGSLLGTRSAQAVIEGLYTIGSIGTVSQNSASDCDIWVCYDKKRFSEDLWRKLCQKINLIKDWMDQHLRLPCYFFVCDIEDIRNNRFGSVDMESAGSTQRNVLKEEFYRTCIVICGRIPLWWVAHDPERKTDYADALTIVEDPVYGHYDIIDFGDLAKIEKDEYFGAAVWHIHKSLSSPLKSIIKMVLLKILLDASERLLICHHFREKVLNTESDLLLRDPSIFTIIMIFRYLALRKNLEQLEFLKKCFYLRCQAKPYQRKNTLKKDLLGRLLKHHPIALSERIRLGNYSNWRFSDQIELGNQLFGLLFKTYRAITDAHAGVASDSDKRDLSILGRKLAVSYQKKPFKISVIQSPSGHFNVSGLKLALSGNLWHVYPENDKSMAIVSHSDIVYAIAFLVWNRLFSPHHINMEPNASQITLQEIINLGNTIGTFFGASALANQEFSNYLKNQTIVNMMIVVSFEQSPWEKDINDLRVIYKNSWGELFVRHFKSPEALRAFFREWGGNHEKIDTSYYLQRNSMYYEKIIARTKQTILPMIL